MLPLLESIVPSLRIEVAVNTEGRHESVNMVSLQKNIEDKLL